MSSDADDVKEPVSDVGKTRHADDAAVLDVLNEASIERYHGATFDEVKDVLHVLRSMPDKGPLARSLGITPGDLGLERTNPQWVNDRPVWVEP